MSVEKGDRSAATAYYRMFLEIAQHRQGGQVQAQDYRIEKAEAKLAELEGIGQ